MANVIKLVEYPFIKAARLAKYGVYDMQGITMLPEALLYKEFGVNAEFIIDHAWGRESCTSTKG